MCIIKYSDKLISPSVLNYKTFLVFLDTFGLTTYSHSVA